jgi:hypothetical protein
MAIKYPATFNGSLPAQFDGLFDWEYLRGCFPRDIMPMDRDAEVELGCKHFISWETKNPGVPIPTGQLLSLERRARLGPDTIIIQWFKGNEGGEWYWMRRDGSDPSGLHVAPRRWSSAPHQDQRLFVQRWSFLADQGWTSYQQLTDTLKELDADLRRRYIQSPTAADAQRAGKVVEFVKGTWP